MSEAVEASSKKEGRESVGEFYKKTRAELDKTSFPSSDDVRKTVIIVIINVIFFAVFLYIIDNVWVFLTEGFKSLVDKIAG